MTERMVLTAEQQELDDKHSALLDLLGNSGWDYAGSGPNTRNGEPGAISLGFNYQNDITALTVEYAAVLLADDESETGLLPGWVILPEDYPESDGYIGLYYEGQVAESFERGVAALVEFTEAQPPINR